MQNNYALKTIKELAEKGLKVGLFNTLEESFEVIEAINSLSNFVSQSTQEIQKLKEQNESFKNTNNDLLKQVDDLNTENLKN